jgi:SAM-dependent methyltransferase
MGRRRALVRSNDAIGLAATFKCRICGKAGGNARFTVREMMFGTGEEFDYVECAVCGCLQIEEIPTDLSPYYPENYYSFERPRARFYGRFKRRRFARHAYGGRSLVGRLLAMRTPPHAMSAWFRRAGVRFDDTILDVGSGGGELLFELLDAGFTNVVGVDPFIARDLRHEGRILVMKRQLEEVEGEYDFITLHHSFEHLAEPHAALRQIQRLLKPNRFALLRLPLVSRFAWRKYATDWAQLDPPRHLYLHTPESVGVLARAAGFGVAGVACDSTAFQFWGSEQCRRGIPLMCERSYFVNPRGSIFSERDLRTFEAASAMLNENGDGDQAAFYLLKT